MPRPAAFKLVIGVVTGAVMFGQLSGCSRRPDLAGVYSPLTNISDHGWLSDGLLELNRDGTAVLQGVTVHDPGGSKAFSTVATQSEGKWWVEGDRVIYEGRMQTASTLEDQNHQESEPMRLAFTIASNGDLVLSAEDMDADSVRYVRDRLVGSP